MPRFSPKRTIALLLLILLSYAIYRDFNRIENRVEENIHTFKQFTPSFNPLNTHDPDKELVVAAGSKSGGGDTAAAATDKSGADGGNGNGHSDSDNNDDKDSSNTSWLYALAGNWQWKVYDTDELGSVPMQKGHEHMVYLSYIIDNYDHLPALVVFIHGGKRYHWYHDDPIYDIVSQLDSLNFPYILSTGFTPLRCTWTPGCPAEIFPRTPLSSKGPPLRRDAEKNYADAWKRIFHDDDGDQITEPVPAVVGAPSSSEFAVTRERIKKRSKEEYKRIRQWLIDTELKDDVSAKILEYMWHAIFQMPSVYCPPADECYCNLYGHCNLTCTLGNCEGRYILPPQTEVPKGWPNLGNGKNGWPVVGWNKPKGEDKKVKEEKEKDGAGEKDGGGGGGDGKNKGGKDKEGKKGGKKGKDGKEKGKPPYEITVAEQGEWKEPE